MGWHFGQRLERFRQVAHMLGQGMHNQLIEILKAIVLAWCLQHETSHMRIHSAGDFFSKQYIKIWIEVAKALPSLGFWFYTRSYRVGTLVEPLAELAALPNVAGWLSVDSECWMVGLAVQKQYPHFGIAMMQDEGPEEGWVQTVIAAVKPSKLIVFPLHGRTKDKLVIPVKSKRLCPAMTKPDKFPHSKIPALAPCQLCKWCLPELKVAT